MSVFTFETEPTRVSSPWLKVPENPEEVITRLEPEPQEGAVEYKLHLLLRPRRPYKTIKSGTALGPQPSDRGDLTLVTESSAEGDLSRPEIASVPEDGGRQKHPLGFYATTSESRKLRLYHLTTQLLWRLQQSMRYNPLGTTDSLIPKLPDDSVALAAAVRPGNLWQGLEESKGALYEIGVADDGTLVGLPEDEMEESLLTLKVMAASLGCVVSVMRRQCVGECEWDVLPAPGNGYTVSKAATRQGQLYVVEASVKPRPGFENKDSGATDRTTSVPPVQTVAVEAKSTTEQLRVTLTGPTDGGKSTLLGTLSTGIFDNGSGRSRTFLLRHRHELASGMTTSVSQMLIGYKNDSHDENLIYSFADRNIDSWEGIHDLSREGRLVFVSDSAGHLRYRRTILRGLIGWAPQWTILCLAANDSETKGRFTPTSSQDEAESPVTEVDQIKAYLDLCLKLRMPLVIVITKLDVATTMSLRGTLTKVLAAVKSAGRVPKLLIKQRIQSDPTRVPAIDEDGIRPLIAEIKASGSLLDFVPIVSTSAVKGEGVGLLHALLQNLPIPPTPTARDYIGLALNPEQPDSIFHIEDKFSLSALSGNTVKDDEAEYGTIVAGYIRFGHLAVGDRVLIGPFPPDDDSMTMTPERRASPGGEGLSVSHQSSSELNRLAMRNAVPASSTMGEWYHARIATIRNLRLPVRLLEPGQTGTIGIIFDIPNEDLSDSIFERPPRPQPKIRKGMVLAVPSKHMVETGLSLQAASGITGVFEEKSTESLIVGSIVKVYIASVRASARITRVSPMWHYPDVHGVVGREADDEEIFVISQEREEAAKQESARMVYEVQLELLSQREWIEMGAQVVIMEGGGRAKSGLEGFVGKVIEIME
ncbi:hypothetical protein VPNG_00318 [Cytospora leucostoma]|uniref:Tr-type G domain-containing protein n=1 Tax=Cytospora leucostoma TaxID=1230097 RepID=A0A423XN46_9PEZI|nr:hypothetical protein VPNG_00318 [Cytospora leucostoma]